MLAAFGGWSGCSLHAKRHDAFVGVPLDPPASESDVVVALRAVGIPAEVIEHAVERGDPEGAIFDAVLMPSIAERTVSAEEIERQGGCESAICRH